MALKLQQVWQIDESNGQLAGADTEKLEELYERREAAAEAVRALDQKFFEDVELTLASEDDALTIDRVRMSRERAVYSQPTRRGRGPFGIEPRDEALVDISGLLRELDISVSSEIDRSLYDYELSMTESLRGRHDMMQQLQRDMETIGISFARGGRGRGGGRGQEVFQRMREMQQQQREADETLIAINRDMLSSMDSLLSAGDAASLQDAYNRRAFPRVFDDAGASATIRKALELDDLSNRQRADISELAAGYNADFAPIAAQMIENPASAGRVPLQRGS